VSRREKLLLNLLAWVVAAVVLGFLGAAELEKRAGLREKITQLEKQIPQYGAHLSGEELLEARRQSLERELEAERSHYYEPGRMDPYRFGTLVREALVANRLRIERYQTLEAGKRMLLEFSVAGSALDLMRFLEAVSASEKYWSMPFLSINARQAGGAVEAVFRIGYETLEPLDS